jgi:hypothetical protein
MKTCVVAFALASLVATSAWAKTESPIAARPGVFTLLQPGRAVVARPFGQHYVLILGVAY